MPRAFPQVFAPSSLEPSWVKHPAAPGSWVRAPSGCAPYAVALVNSMTTETTATAAAVRPKARR
jgi:hypothetical protein